MSIDDEVLDVSGVLEEWSRPTRIKTVTETTVDFVKSETVASRTQDCVVQVQQPDQLIKRGLDVTVRHIRVHSHQQITQGELIEFNGRDYRVLHPSQWDGYGYAEVDAADTKQPVKAVTS